MERRDTLGSISDEHNLDRTVLRVGTRGSALARAQTALVVEALKAARPELLIEETIIRTEGDRRQDVALREFGGKGAFTKELEVALAEGRIDCAVHSLKDLPTAMPDGLALGAVMARGNPMDVLVAREEIDLATFEGLAGTSSLRRTAQLQWKHPHLRTADIRGNVPTRLEKLMRGEFDALVLAAAGIERLGLAVPWMRPFALEDMYPAPGQGAIAVQVRAGEEEAFSAIHDPVTAACVAAERAFLAALGGGCHAPVGALGEHLGGGMLGIKGRLMRDGECLEARSVGGINRAEMIGEMAAEMLER
ncbi:MAG: hydroxymethylbilane synthase [Sumerlaeia bacterium]